MVARFLFGPQGSDSGQASVVWQPASQLITVSQADVYQAIAAATKVKEET